MWIILIIVLLVVIVLYNQKINKLQQMRSQEKEEYEFSLNSLGNKKNELQKNLDSLEWETVDQSRRFIADCEERKSELTTVIENLRAEIQHLSEERLKTEKQEISAQRKINKIKELYRAMEHSIDNFIEYVPALDKLKIPTQDLEEFAPTITLQLHYMDLRDLRKAFNENNKQIEKLLEQYSIRYTTKANKAIYDLMVIALRAELQNILYNLRGEKLENAIETLQKTTAKYLAIAAEGNQSIAGTITKFIGEIEYLFINAIKIEHTYYIRKEQARQEQLAIKEQMRQEAAERKALEEERKKIAAEESKYEGEIEKLQSQLDTAEDAEKAKLQARILELQAQLSEVVVKKENIINLQNGKAGNVYIISNLGAFGEKMFKIGMTRRLDPMDRIDELGDASVPFKFDVHSLIFSDDAVSLETQLHERLNNKRVNKVNMRKEFFYSTLDELEALVQEIEPTAEFNKTMLAEEYRQSQDGMENLNTPIHFDDYDEE